MEETCLDDVPAANFEKATLEIFKDNESEFFLLFLNNERIEELLSYSSKVYILKCTLKIKFLIVLRIFSTITRF